MSIKTQKLIVAPLRGIDQRWEANPNQAENIQNMTWSDQDSWRTSFGYRRLVSDSKVVSERNVVVLSNQYDTDAPISSLYWFSQHGNSLHWLIYEDQDGMLRYFNGSKAPEDPSTKVQYIDGKPFDGTATNHKRNTSNVVSNTVYAMYGTNLYMFNGVDAPIVFDGKKCTRAGFSGRPGLVETNVTDKLAIREGSVNGVGYAGSKNEYRYVVSFVNERGQESRFSPASPKSTFDTKDALDAKNTVGGAANHPAGEYTFLVQVDLPIGPTGTVARRLYRTQNMVSFIEEVGDTGGTATSNATTQLRESIFGREFYFVDEIQDNVTSMYVDSKSDVELGTLHEEGELGDFPTSSTLAAVFKNTLFVAGDLNSELRYSRPMHPEVFPSNNVFILSDSQTTAITGLYPTGDALVVFKQRSIHLIKGDPVSGFFAQTLTTDAGCICQESIREIPGVGLVFLAVDGVYVLEGTFTTSHRTTFFKLSQGLRNIFNRVNTEFARLFRSVVYHKDREYWLVVAVDDKTVPDLALKFNYEIGAWSTYTSSEVCGLIEVQDHRGYLYLAGPNSSSTTSSRGLYVYGGTNDLGALGAVSSTYVTAHIPFNSVYENFAPARAQARVVGLGNTINLSVVVNREPAVIATSSSATQTRPLEDKSFPLYDTATFDGTAIYQEHRPVTVRFDFSTMHKGPVNELQLRFTCSDEMEIINYELEGRLGRSRDVINLTEKFGGSIRR
tara:strand:+ start:1155 stop:3335 length:2181 start_codon:yes stop_codon:yes gene_type:complete